jgi:hypothetical protein
MKEALITVIVAQVDMAICSLTQIIPSVPLLILTQMVKLTATWIMIITYIKLISEILTTLLLYLKHLTPIVWPVIIKISLEQQICVIIAVLIVFLSPVLMNLFSYTVQDVKLIIPHPLHQQSPQQVQVQVQVHPLPIQ